VAGCCGVVVNPQQGLMEWSVFDMDPYVNPYVGFRGVALNPAKEIVRRIVLDMGIAVMLIYWGPTCHSFMLESLYPESQHSNFINHHAVVKKYR
jgi:hypothetical protein